MVEEGDYVSIFDEERKRIGVTPIGKQKSIFDDERKQFTGEGNTYTYDTTPIQPVQLPTPQQPGKPGFLDMLKQNAIGLSQAITEPLNAVGKGFDYVAEKTGLDRVGGAIKGAINPEFTAIERPENESYGDIYKRYGQQTLQNIKDIGRSTLEGAKDPKQASKDFTQTLSSASDKLNFDPVTKTALTFEAEAAADPFNLIPYGLAAKGLQKGAEAAGLLKKVSKVEVLPNKAPQIEPLGLPEPRSERLRKLSEGNVQEANYEPIYGQGETVYTNPTAMADNFGLPEPKLSPATTARVETKPNVYLQKFESLMSEAQKLDLPPGREREYLDDLWSRMAGPEDPNLNELIDLAYPKVKTKLKPGLASEARQQQAQRDVYGVPSKVKTLEDRYTTEIGRASMPETKAGRLPIEPEVLNVSPKRARIDITPQEIGSPKKLSSSILPTVDQMEARAVDTSFGDAELLKDISGFSAQTRDFYRNMEKTLGKERAAKYIEPFNAAKKTNIEEQETWLNRLKSEVVDKLGIDKGSKLSALVQKFGEKQIDLDALKAAAPNDWQKVVEADQWFRKSYDELIDKVNSSRATIYPNNPEKIVPKRNDYYRHFQELNGLEGLKNLFDSPSQISPSLAGISEFVTPKSKWAGFMQKRGLGPFKNDAVGGFLNYLPSASYAVHIDPQIPVMRTLGKELAEATEKSKNLNGFIEYLNDFSNDLAGKTNPADRFFQKVIPGGRKTMAAVQWLNNRVKSNTILGNVGSTVSQLANIPNGVAFAKQYSVKGAGETLKEAFTKSPIMEQSGFLKERYSGQLYRQFDTRWIDQPKKFAEWMMETADRTGTYFVWNSAYAKGIAEKVANPIAYADDAARKLVAGRGIGEVPLLQKSKLVQIVAPFQLEVANLWRVMGDFVSKKDAGAILTLFVGNYLFNRGMEQVKGSGVTFDPIQALIEASGEDLSPVQRAGRIGGEILSNIPGGQTIASLAPEYGGSILGINLPTRKQLFGDNDPTRFGSGLVAANGLTDPLSKAVLPFGGNQLKKTIEGTQALIDGAAYSKKGGLKFPVDKTPIEGAKNILFGPNSTSIAREYYDKGLQPLSAKDTELFKQSANPKQFYDDKIQQRDVDRINSKITEIRKDDTMKEPDKQKEYKKLLEKLRKAANGG